MDTPPDPTLIPAFPSPTAQYNSRAFVATTFILHGIALVTFGGRIWSRSRPVFRMHMDDYVCTAAYIFILTNSTLLLLTVPYTFTSSPTTFFLSNAETAFKYAIISQPLWAWSMSLLKISFALMLLRIEQTLTWRRFLWFMIAVQVVVGVYNTLGIVLQCVPLRKAWDLVGVVQGKCWSKETQGTSTIVVAAINIITDFVFSLLPITFLRKIQRPMRERVVVGVLMGLGIFAGVVSIVKISVAAQFGRTGDMINESILIGMWSVIEELVGLIVICVPCLRSPFQRAVQSVAGVTVRMRRYGMSRSYGRTYEASEGPKERSRSRSRLAAMLEGSNDSGFKLERVRNESSGPSSPNGDVIKRPCEIWCTKEVMVDHDSLSRMPSYEQARGGPDAVWMDHDFSLKDVEMGRAF
ncbi:hypothetical protein FB567DRAFT_239799 [Paraphoma chrysanthemicola]|uniref:Rhodopsin domain-containing protein n=1 Tax=Paraphoma chrysanthemicola TaxID=798071 RepID=A0A8K0W261_9PLEO|nr:hypothetical protein FB567DRAFT_239799 [Paraphoma chrysanthemicola]